MEEITPQKAESWAKETHDIHDEQGRVADLGAAQEIARDQATKGMDAALATEKRLDREVETELTAIQEINVKIMEGLTKDKEGNPRNINAFIEKIVKKDGELVGDKYMILNPITKYLPSIDENHSPEAFDNMIVFFCKDGAFSFQVSNSNIRYQDIPEYTCWGDFGKEVHDNVVFYKDESQYKTELRFDFRDGIGRATTADVNKLDLSKTSVRENLAQYIKYAEYLGLENKIKQEEKKAMLDPDEVLSGLGL